MQLNSRTADVAFRDAVEAVAFAVALKLINQRLYEEGVSPEKINEATQKTIAAIYERMLVAERHGGQDSRALGRAEAQIKGLQAALDISGECLARSDKLVNEQVRELSDQNAALECANRNVKRIRLERAELSSLADRQAKRICEYEHKFGPLSSAV